jgi:hypothetical protein
MAFAPTSAATFLHAFNGLDPERRQSVMHTYSHLMLARHLESLLGRQRRLALGNAAARSGRQAEAEKKGERKQTARALPAPDRLLGGQ